MGDAAAVRAVARRRATRDDDDDDDDDDARRAWSRHLVYGVRGYVDTIDPLSADRARAAMTAAMRDDDVDRADATEDGDVDADAEDVLVMCDVGDAARAKTILKNGNACVRWLLFGERATTLDTAVHGARDATRCDAMRCDAMRCDARAMARRRWGAGDGTEGRRGTRD
jgi:hypothetical protein